MSLTTHSPSKQEMSNLLRRNINNQVIKALQSKEVPWQKPWVGRGNGVGFPRHVFTKKKFFGVNAILLQMAARRCGYSSNLWGTVEQFTALGMVVKDRPDNVPAGEWGTETVFYKLDVLTNSVHLIPAVVYNLEQVKVADESLLPNPIMKPDYNKAEKVLHASHACIQENNVGRCAYFYGSDTITLPTKKEFEAGLGGLPGYYESLAHELIHWTEPRLGFDTDTVDPIKELRAEIGAAFMVEELGCPHSVAFRNFNQYRLDWVDYMQDDPTLIFRIAASACKAVDHLLAYSSLSEERFNQLDENAA